MDCTVLVVAHGKLARELVATSEMLIGAQDNVITVEFMPGENLESLMQKLGGIIEQQNIQGSLLLVVDMFSGTPFNASTWFVKHRPETQVITGVNIPMLVNILLERKDAEDLKQLVNLACEIGQDAVKTLQN